MAIKLLIADDHGVIRAGLRALLNGVSEIEVVGEAGDGYEVLEKNETLKPDIILMDLSMPGMDGIETTRQLRQRNPDVKVLILTVHEDESLLKEAIRSGAAGYIVKRAAESELLNAIRAIRSGDMYVHPALTRFFVKDISPATAPRHAQVALDVLTQREIVVLKLLARGYTNRQIADELGISPRTVEGHRANLSAKLGRSSRVELVNYAEENGLLDFSK
ncbi:MAG: response regulator transcription factor [Chloroflexota bacterium]